MFGPIIRQIKRTYEMAEPQDGKTVIKNVASLSGLQVITYVLPIIVMPYLFRVLGPEKFGLIAFAQSFVQYFIILTDYGFSVSATKDISIHLDDPEELNTIYSSVMIIKSCFAILSFLTLALLVHFIPRFSSDWMIYLLGFGIVIGNALFPIWFFQGTERMQYTANLNILGELTCACSIFLYIRTPHDYLLVPLIYSYVSIMTGLIAQYLLLKRFAVTFKKPSFTDIRRQLQNSWNIFISVLAINAYTTTRVFAVGLLTNNTLTGFYSIAEKIANAAQTFPLSSFSQAVFPRLSKIYQTNRLKAYELMRQIQQITVKVSMICLPLIFLCAPFIIKLVCGANYPQAVMSLRLLLIAVFFVASNAFRVQFLLVCGTTDIYSKIHITMALIGLPLIISLIYAFSYVGAALATACIECGTFTITYFAVRSLNLSGHLKTKPS